MNARDVLGPGSPLSQSLPGYEDRPAQLAMASAVEDALAAGEPLFVEAGTGTGKTLAYLVPAILSGKKVVVSTATRALQEQIFDKDVPLVAKALAAHGVTFRAALMKGLTNYVCKRRLREALSGTNGQTNLLGLSADARTQVLLRIERWAQLSETGDRAELEDVPEDSPAWHDVQSSTETRIGATCPHFQECFVTRMKQTAQDAQLVVVNHHLFFADLALRSGPAEAHAGAIPAFDAVIFDEAHQLEDIATDFFGSRVSTARVESIAREAARWMASSGSGGAGAKARSKDKDPARPLFEQALEAAQGFFDALGNSVRLQGGEARRVLSRDDWSSAVLERFGKLDACLEALGGHLSSRERSDDDDDDDDDERETLRRGEDALSLLARRVRALRSDLGDLVRGASAHGQDGEAMRVAWLQVGDRSITIGSSPIEIGGILRRSLFDRIGGVVCTSATLATGTTPSFHFAKARLGAPPETRELVVASPFDFAERSALYLPRDLPEPSDAAFEKAAVDRIVELVGVTAGGAFVLCTSTRAMKRLYAALVARLSMLVLVQGEGPKHTLLARFRDHGDAVLVATMSFWEGVDVPGRALRLVVIDKIPFAVPTDPVIAARCAELERQGGNAFAEYSVPSAAITLKQGFGRLIRTQKDAGIVAILDRRVVTRGYGKALLGGLPPARRHSHLDDVRAFWHAVDPPVELGLAAQPSPR